MPMTKADVLNHLIQTSQQLRQSGDTQNADMLDQKINAIKTNPQHQDLNQPLHGADQIIGQQQNPVQTQVQAPVQSPTQPVAPVTQPITNPGDTQQLNVSMPKESTQDMSGMNPDINALVQKVLASSKSLNPTPIQSIGNAISILGGGKPTVTPAQEIATKAVEHQLSMNPIDYALKKSLISQHTSSTDVNKAKLDPESQINELKQNAADEKTQASLQKRFDSLNKDMDPARYRAGAFGVAKQVFDRGERLSSMMDAADAFQKGGADSRQIEELAIGLNSMLSGSNTGAQEQVRALVPHSIMGNATKLKEWLLNDPTGMNQQAFVARMRQSVDREMATTKAQMNRTRFSRLSAYKDLETNHPQEFEDALRGWGVDPQEYQSWKQGGFKDISAIQSVNNSNGAKQLGKYSYE